MFRTIMLAGAAAAIAVLTIVSCGSQGRSTGIDLRPAQIMIPVSQVEVKGATDGIPAPEVNPETLSKGYRHKAPGVLDAGNPNRWEVSAYFFEPSFVTVIQGDSVTLRIIVVNGDRHVDWVEAPDGTEATTKEVRNRGREYTINFRAEQAGYYVLHCDEHAPTMRMTILSLPRKA